MIDPQSLDLKTLPWLPLEERSKLPKLTGIYFAVDSSDKAQYIGKATNLRSRWESHHKYEELSSIKDVRIAYLFIDAVELLTDIETSLIKWFNPPLNELLTSPSPSISSSIQRKNKAFRIDERVIDGIYKLARKRNISVNRLLEIQMFKYLQTEGVIDKNASFLGR